MKKVRRSNNNKREVEGLKTRKLNDSKKQEDQK